MDKGGVHARSLARARGGDVVVRVRENRACAAANLAPVAVDYDVNVGLALRRILSY